MMELFNFCQYSFDLLSLGGFCFAETENEHCLSFSKLQRFTMVDINKSGNLIR